MTATPQMRTSLDAIRQIIAGREAVRTRADLVCEVVGLRDENLRLRSQNDVLRASLWQTAPASFQGRQDGLLL
jgi:hypothetical protein